VTPERIREIAARIDSSLAYWWPDEIVDFAAALFAAQEEDNERPADCSGDPAICPDNEGRGCFCSDRERIDRDAAKVAK
jgi:hypothetical protein